VDLATGSGAVAMVMQAARPRAGVVATELDPVAVRCARRNGVDVLPGHLDRPLPADLVGRVDVLCGVLPYVPTGALGLLPRDVLAFEPRAALDGGPDGLAAVAAVVAGSRRWLRPGGWLLLEVGGDQVPAVTELFEASGHRSVDVLVDADGDRRAVVGRRPGWPRWARVIGRRS
jgi:release factor glutamine methyltransferase